VVRWRRRGALDVFITPAFTTPARRAPDGPRFTAYIQMVALPLVRQCPNLVGRGADEPVKPRGVNGSRERPTGTVKLGHCPLRLQFDRDRPATQNAGVCPQRLFPVGNSFVAT